MMTDGVGSSDRRRKMNDVIDMMASGYRREPGSRHRTYEVEVSSSSSIYTSTLFSPYHFAIGSRVVIQHLQKNTNLNNILAMVEEYMEQEGRFKVRPLGRQGKQKTKSKFLSISGKNIKAVEPSSFVAHVKSFSGRTVQLPLTCRIELDHSTQNRLAVRLMYSDFLGIDKVTYAAREIEGEEFVYLAHESPAFGIVTTPFMEEDLRGQPVEGDEILILYDKPAIRDLYDAMVDYELVQELETVVDVGLLGSFPLCRLRFPYQVEQS